MGSRDGDALTGSICYQGVLSHRRRSGSRPLSSRPLSLGSEREQYEAPRIEEADGERARRSVADAFCKHCGLCCDGTFFGSVVIDEAERESLGRVGLRVVDNNGALSMPQSCSALRGCLCSVYADRPKACREYECTLRERLLDGSTSDDAARGSLARLRALVTATRGAFNLPTTSIWEAILSLDDPEPTDPMSEAGRKFDAGVEAVSELLKLTRAVFEPDVGGDRSSTARTRDEIERAFRSDLENSIPS